MRRYKLGTLEHPFSPDDSARASIRARDLRFEHIDVMYGTDPATLALPVGCYTAAPHPKPGNTTTPAYPKGEGRWEKTVNAFRNAPGCLLEPAPGLVVESVETARAMMAEVPGLKLLVDTGHVACWGEDPVELLEYAGHIQLRQAAPGKRQLHIDDPDGVVDFAAVLKRLEQIDYQGALSIEYMDKPAFGFPLEDPIQFSVDLAQHIRALMGASS